MAAIDDMDKSGDSFSTSIITELTTRIAKVLTKTQSAILTTKTSATPIGIKLDVTNYALWPQVVEMYISDSLLRYISPAKTNGAITSTVTFPSHPSTLSQMAH